MVDLLLGALGETLVMLAAGGAVALVLGLPLGVLLLVTSPGHLWPRPWLNRGLGALVNAARSTPFIILLVALTPLTRLVVGTSIGTAAAIVPLALAATPFLARLAEAALREVDGGLVEAARAMGASRWQLVAKVLLPEALPALTAAATVMLVNLVSYSAMAGAVGGGGLGDIGIRYGYQRFQPGVMLVVVVALMLLVQLIQSLGDALARRWSRK